MCVNNKDILTLAFSKQQELLRRFKCNIENLSIEEIEKWSKEFILAMHAELSELLEWQHWKHWKINKVKYDDERIKEIHLEIIDIFCFLVDLSLVWGLDPSKFISLYKCKSDINIERQNNNY